MKDLAIPRYMKLGVSAAAAIVMGVFCAAVLVGKSANLSYIITTSVAFSVIYLVALLLLSFREETDMLSSFAFGVLSMATLVFIRVCLLYYASADYNNFLAHWVNDFKNMSVFDALSTPIGDYNVPYLYILLIISKIPAPDLVLIKAVSCLFDILLGYAAMLITRKLTNSKSISLLAFILTTAIPTVVLNSGMWGQCDSIYGFFCLMTLYFALCKKGANAVIMFSLAFAFKLQAMFLIPALIICLFVGNIKLRHLIFFPLVNILAVVPTVISGRNFLEVLTIYFRQTQNYPSLDMNAPSIFRFVFNVNFDWFNMLGIMLGGFGVLCLLYFAFRKRDKIDDRALVTFFYLSAIAVPYLLPRMHERYFFVADVLSFVLFLVARKLWYVPLINIFASFVAYAYYLFYGVTLINYIYVAFALLVIIILVIKDLYKYLSTSSSVGKEGQNG